MTLEELNKEDDLFMYLTLSDVVLFVENEKLAESMINEIRKKSFDEINIDFDSIIDKEMKRIVESRAAGYFSKYFNELIEKNEEYIDFDKYILLAGYRNYRMIKLLSNNENRNKIPGFDELRKGMKKYAVAIQRINTLLEDKDVRINYNPRYVNGVLQGFWDDETQRMVPIDISTKALKRICESKEVQYALSLKDGDVNFNAVQIEVDSPEGVYPKTKYDYNKRPKYTSKMEDNPIINQRITEIMNFAMKNNGIHFVDGKKYIAASSEGLYEIPFQKLALIREGIGSDFKTFFEKIRKNGMTLEDEIEMYGKLEVLRNPGFADKETNALYKNMLAELKEEILIDPLYNRQHEELVFNYILSTRESITEELAKATSIDDKDRKSVRDQFNFLKEYRKDIIMELYSEGVIPKGILENSGFINELSNTDIIEKYFKKKEFISSKDAVEFLGRKKANRIDEDKEPYEIVGRLYAQKKNEVGVKAVTLKRYLEILSNDELIKLFLDGVINEDDLNKKGIRKVDIEKIESTSDLKNAIERLDNSQKYAFTEQELMKLYGLRLSGKTVIEYAEKEKISPEKILELYRRESIKKLFPENALTAKDLASFYTYDIINKLQKEGKINQRFIEDFNNVLLELNEEERNNYFEKFKNEILVSNGDEKNVPKDALAYESKGKIVEFYKLGIMPDDFLKNVLDKNDLIKLYEDEKLNDVDIISLYSKGILSHEMVSEIVSDDEIYDAFDSNIVDYKALRNISSDYLIVALEDKKIGFEELFDLYSTEMTEETMLEILDEEKTQDVEFGKFIKEGTSEEKIEVLLKKFYISHDELSDLVSKGLITEEKAEKYVQELSSHEEYEKLFSIKNRRAILTKVTEPGDEKRYVERNGYSIGNGTNRNSTFKIDPELKEKFMKTLGADERTIYLTGNENSLDGYTIYGFEDSQIMIFVNHEKPSQATYITSFLQGKFFLNKIKRKSEMHNVEEIEDGIESSATKAELRETPHVKVRNSSKMWARNVYDSMCKLDPSLRGKYKKDKEYREKIDKISEEIHDDYILRRD